MGELLSGAEGQFRGQGMGTPGTGPAGGEHGPVPGAPLSVEDALDGDLDAYLDRELFVCQRPDSDSEQAAVTAAATASGSMRALLDLAEEESRWLKTLPAPSPSVEALPEPEAPAVEIPEWMRMSPGANVTTPFAAMLSPADPATVQAHPESHGSVGTDAEGLPATPWSVPASAPLASAPAYHGNLLPGIAPPPHGVPLPAWASQHAAPMAQYPQQWGMPPQAEPQRIAGMKTGAFLGAAAVGALAAGLLVVAGLHFREHLSGTHEATVANGQDVGRLQGAPNPTGAQAGGVGIAGTAQGGPGVLPSGVLGIAGAAQGGPGVNGEAQVGNPGARVPSGLSGEVQAGTVSLSGVAGAAQSSGTGPGVSGEAQASSAFLPGIPGTAQAGIEGLPGTATGAQGQPLPGTSAAQSGTSEPSGAQQAAASVAGTVLSTAQGDVQGAANGLRAQPPTTGRVSGPPVGGLTLTSGQPPAVATRAPSARKAATKTALPSSTTDEAEVADTRELAFNETESASADEESTPAEATEAEEPESELDEDFARELGFTEDAEQKAATPKAPERTVYIPPAPDAKEHLTPDDVKAVVVANQPAITACIRQHAQGTPVEKGGRFLVRWSVLPSGDTSSVSMDTDTLKATELGHCIEDVVRRWKFPAHQVRMQEPILFPFVF
ncbi:AgmX/PglI C-terminal domain-containing protein [Pyxidicoccus sp. MSG2]|uniref:AgmX/PglI C-terminal domain-containing protein n=1 Tax=Pyxidicoccus sp. MSG2 TaxID=2996790 RepID=UPI00226E7141|nr:AgmX/PglI C-terminal domain-containing protein [Pyxidicoccus sp. MSG2]MCY1017531.1 AgmX/PglI C-terminal domain-containing protein [Pyxidicoccus sp. MSG2]